jgi:arsenate reductase
MAEAGVDIAGQRSKHVEEVSGIAFDCVVTVCDRADKDCPVFSGETRRLHMGFDDPPRLATGASSEEQALEHYRRVRDEICVYVSRLPDVVADGAGTGPRRTPG